MSKNVLLKTNALVCFIIVAGFLLTSLRSYHSNRDVYMNNMEHISSLTTEGIYYRLESAFTKPINISLTMANDSFLIDFLKEEQGRLDDQAYIEIMRDYLNAYRLKYSYDSVFLVSANTGRYYNFHGIDRILTKDNVENEWFYDFLRSGMAHSLNVDNDEAALDEVTVFINCAIRDGGETIGVVGVGFQIGSLQSLLHSYQEAFGVETFLVNDAGIIEISSNTTGYEMVDHFTVCGYPTLKDEILRDKESTFAMWLEEEDGRNYLMAQYIPDLTWHLIVENSTKDMDQQTQRQLMDEIILVACIALIVLIVISCVIRGFNQRIVHLTEAHQAAFRTATEELFDTIYEINITENRAAGRSTEQFFESLGLKANAPFDHALRIIAHQQIKEEYREGYLSMFSTENVMRVFQKGETALQYEFQTDMDGIPCHWMRIDAHIYHSAEDDSVRMFIYRQDVEEVKRKEILAQTDALTGLLNKAATERHIQEVLAEKPDDLYGFFILDIDNFKTVNDQFGHAVGDEAIVKFAETIKRHFRKDDIVGRIGGDEFAVFVPLPDRDWCVAKLQHLSIALRMDIVSSGRKVSLSASIGAAISPLHGNDFGVLYRNADKALYKVKEKGKDGYRIFDGKHLQ